MNTSLGPSDKPRPRTYRPRDDKISVLETHVEDKVRVPRLATVLVPDIVEGDTLAKVGVLLAQLAEILVGDGVPLGSGRAAVGLERAPVAALVVSIGAVNLFRSRRSRRQERCGGACSGVCAAAPKRPGLCACTALSDARHWLNLGTSRTGQADTQTQRAVHGLRGNIHALSGSDIGTEPLRPGLPLQSSSQIQGRPQGTPRSKTPRATAQWPVSAKPRPAGPSVTPNHGGKAPPAHTLPGLRHLQPKATRNRRW